MTLLEQFLQQHTIRDIQQAITGELLEHSTELATYFYGNGELIISPADESQAEQVFVIDTYGTNSYLMEL